jgi:hypothetical protein
VDVGGEMGQEGKVTTRLFFLEMATLSEAGLYGFP